MKTPNLSAAAIGILFLILFLYPAGKAQAQVLPEPESWTFEVGVNPLADEPVFIDRIRVRNFDSHDVAYRLGADLRLISTVQPDDSRHSDFRVAVAPGIEWHALQYERISAYYGAEAVVRYNSAGSRFGVDLNALAGVDVHFLERFYAGAEVGYGLQTDLSGVDVLLGGFAFPGYRVGVVF